MKLSENQLTMVEAVYLNLIDDSNSYSFKLELSRHIYHTNIYCFIYLDWLLHRWYVFYARHKFDLPKRNKI
jgi:hypothetical protein